MQLTTTATVRTWDDEHGWGVLDSPATPGGCWTHYAALDVAGYRTVSPGQQVSLTAEAPGQDGFPWRAVRVWIYGVPRAEEGGTESSSTESSGAYASELTITMDDEP